MVQEKGTRRACCSRIQSSQLANYTTGFDSRIGYANEYVANDKNQHLRGPEYATSIGLLMESLKIRDKKPVAQVEEKQEEIVENNANTTAQEVAPEILEAQKIEAAIENRRSKLTFGQSLMEKVKKFFEETE